MTSPCRGTSVPVTAVPATLVLMLALPALAAAQPRVTYDTPQPRYAVPPPCCVEPEPPAPPPRPAPIIVERDPYDTSGIVIVGGGFGGMMLHAGDATVVAPSPLVHLGLAVGSAEFGLRLNLLPEAIELDGPGAISLYATQASFSYRFLDRAVVHPVAGIGLESIVGAPERGDVGPSFAVTARLGRELAFPLAGGALALGLDATGHLPFAASEAFPLELETMLGFGAYLDWRF